MADMTKVALKFEKLSLLDEFFQVAEQFGSMPGLSMPGRKR